MSKIINNIVKRKNCRKNGFRGLEFKVKPKVGPAFNIRVHGNREASSCVASRVWQPVTAPINLITGTSVATPDHNRLSDETMQSMQTPVRQKAALAPANLRIYNNTRLLVCECRLSEFLWTRPAAAYRPIENRPIIHVFGTFNVQSDVIV